MCNINTFKFLVHIVQLVEGLHDQILNTYLAKWTIIGLGAVPELSELDRFRSLKTRVMSSSDTPTW